MSFTLPDIDIGSWTEYQKQELQRQLDEKMQGFTLQSAIDEKVAGLQEIAGGINPFDQPEPQVAAAPPEPVAPVVTPPPEPAVVQPPPAPVVAPPPPPPPVQEAQPAGPSPLQSAMQAVQQAGGDVGAFIEAFNSGVGDQGTRARAALQQVITPPTPTPAVRPDLVPPTQPSFPERVSAGQVARVTTERPTPPPAQAGGVNPNPSPDEVRAYITEAARARGIDPSIAITVANSEGGMEAARRGTFKTGSSWWPFQLHYGGAGYEHLGNVAGMGNQFTRETGFAPGDPNAWQAATDYALDRAKKSGWGAWYGAKARGITGFAGIDRSVPDDPGLFQAAVERGKRVAGDVTTGAQQVGTAAMGQISQFGDAALSAGEAAAACGPAAAVRFAQRFGRNPTLREAVDLAKTVGWTAQQGMAGIASEHKLMQKLGIPVDLVMGRDWNRVTQEAQTGNPVTISTSKHYFTIDDYDPKTGKYHVGSSGTDLRGGSDWMTSAQMEAALGGGVMQGALIADNPAVATQSIAGAETNPLDWVGRQKDSVIQQIQQLGGGARETVEQGVTDLRRGAEEAVSSLGTRAEDLGDIAVQQLDRAVEQVAHAPEAVAQHVIGPEPEEWTQAGRDIASVGQTAGQFITDINADLQRQGIENLNRPLLERILAAPIETATGPLNISRATTAALERAGVPGHEQYGFEIPTPLGAIQVGPRELIGGAAELLAPGGAEFAGPTRGAGRAAARELAEAAERVAPEVAEAGGRFVRSGMPAEAEAGFAAGMPTGGRRPVESVDDIARNAVEDAGLTRAVAEPEAPPAPGTAREAFEGAAARPGETVTVEGPAGPVSARVGEPPEGPPPSRGGGYDPRSDPDPANQKIGEMLDARPPKEDKGNYYQRFVRGLFNRSEAPDRFQEQALKDADWKGSLEKLPQHLDLSSLLREQGGGSWAEILVKTVLQPAIRLAGDDVKAVSTVLVHQNNMDVEKAIGGRVRAEAADVDIPSPLRDARTAAAARVRAREEAITRLETDINVDPKRVRDMNTQLNRDRRVLENAERRVEAARGKILQSASEKGVAAGAAREFSGGLKAADAERAIQSVYDQLGPERAAKVQESLAGVYKFVDDLREDMFRGGLIDEAELTRWRTEHPHWVPTRILDYLDEGGESGALKSGTKISMSDNGVRAYSIEGSEKFREDPLSALIDVTHSVQNKVRRNMVANAFVELDMLRPEGKRLLTKTDEPAKAGEPIVQRIKDGTVERYKGPREVAAAVNGPVIEYAPGFVRDWTSLYRNLITSMNPAFALLRNPTYDIPSYFGRELIRHGGSPFMVPRLAAELMHTVPDVFSGMLKGEITGPKTQAYFREGGGGSTWTARTVDERAQQVREMAGQSRAIGEGGYIIDSSKGMQDVLKQLATLQPIGRSIERGGRALSTLSERVELLPRVASTELARKRGATPARAVLGGRTVTMDFNEGGTLAKTINSFVPFFNVGMQSPAVLKRAIAENPPAAVAVLTYTAALPAVMAEAWNRSDVQRSRDYDDVPEYIKNQGVVIMLPFGESSVDRFGNRVPNHYLLRTGVATPFAIAGRETAQRTLAATKGFGGLVPGEVTPRDWQELLSALTFSISPIRADEAGDVPTSLTPEFFPGMTTAAQLMMNRDWFRNRQIVTERRDQEAAQLAKEVAAGMTAVGRMVDPTYEAPPSAVEFAVRDLLGGWGNILLGGREMLPGAEPSASTAIQNKPIIGGALTAVGVGNVGGEQLHEAREHMLTGSARRLLESGGVKYEPGPARTEIRGMPLLRNEQTQYQQLVNRYVDDAIQNAARGPDWEQAPPAAREQIISRVVEAARSRAANEVMGGLEPAEIDRRTRLKSAAPGTPPPTPEPTRTGRGVAPIQRPIPGPREAPTRVR